jgi:cell wall-associated NlpC family hydrolase
VTTQAATKTVKYKVKSGDSLYGIAKKNHTTVIKIRKANGMKKGQTLKMGKVIKVPKYVSSSKKKKKVVKRNSRKTTTTLAKYRIKKGDTLSSIARKHHTSVTKIRKANGMKKGTTLRLGRTVKVPQKSYKVVKAKKRISNKKLVASLSNLDTVKLGTKIAKKPKKFAISDIFFKGSKSDKDKCRRIEKVAKKKLGKRYVWGASGTKNTYDCSSFTKYVYRKNGIAIPRTSIMQSKHGKYVKRKDLKKGDLIFFDTSKRRKGYVNHVGIYLGNNKFIHASSAKKRVVVSSLSKFYAQRYKGARRPS